MALGCNAEDPAILVHVAEQLERLVEGMAAA
jgi:hypothetical protein